MWWRRFLAFLLVLVLVPGALSTLDTPILIETDPVVDPLSLGFTVDVTGRGSPRIETPIWSGNSPHGIHVQQVAIQQSEGVITIQGRDVDMVAIYSVPWPEFDLHLYHLIGGDGEQIYNVWLYCQGGKLIHVFVGSSHGVTLVDERASGTCTHRTSSSTPRADIPALRTVEPPPAQGFRIDGPEIYFDGTGPGTIVHGGHTMRLLPYLTVDCTQVCGSSGWWELHSLVHDPEGPELYHGILYLRENDPDTVLFGWGFDMTRVVHTRDRTYTAGWSSTL